MSATISANDLKFVIFGSGHDYTRIDSGEGVKPFFSHPKVPLNSVNYAGQYYFLVPDEDGVLFDAVKDDIAHCTFTPALNTAFSATGETEIKVKYRREYIHDEETILVEKELKQTIEVVDHGTVSSSGTSPDNVYDIYTDGYIFWRPTTTSSVVGRDYFQTSYVKVKASSNIPWRATGIGHNLYDGEPFLFCDTSLDLSELETADLTNVTRISNLIKGKGTSDVVDLTPLKGWDVSNVTDLHRLFYWNKGLDTKPLENWNVSNVTDLSYAFKDFTGDYSGIEKWDVSGVEDFTECFGNDGNNGDISLNDVDFLAYWNTESSQNMSYIFSGNMTLTDLSGIAGWNVSNNENFEGMFYTCIRLKDLSPLENWDVGKGENFSKMFGGYWIRDLSPLANWDMSSATKTDEMFRALFELQDVSPLANWDMSNVTSASEMFYAWHTISDADLSDRSYWTYASGWYFSDTFSPVYSTMHPSTPYFERDASGVNGWNIRSGLGVFVNASGGNTSNWQNVPSWN